MIESVERINNMKYSNAPIEEALIDVRFAPIIEDYEKMKELANSFKAELPLQAPKQSFRFNFNSDQETLQKDNFAGIALKDDKPGHVLQLDKDGITYSVIKNYDSWEKFESNFLKYWQEFKKLASRTALIKRVGVRFINKFPVSINKLDDLQQYSKIKVAAPLEDQELKDVFTRLLISPRPDVNCIITQALNRQNNSQDLVLDIDVFSEKNLSLQGSALEELLSDFRKIKNNVFEHSLTQEIKESFK